MSARAATATSSSVDGRALRGLTTEEARQRLLEFGPNDPVPRDEPGAWRAFLARFANPLILILLLAGIASLLLGDAVNALLVFCIVGVSAGIEFVQTRRSEHAGRALRDRVAQTVLVLRDGRFVELPRSLIVPGDCVRLDAGDVVPADARLLEGRDLHVSEAALTGESLPIEKHPADPLLMGSSVVSGTGQALVQKTGLATAFSEIAKSLSRRPPQSEFERGLTRFGAFILRWVLFLVLFVCLASALLKRDPFESLLFSVALAVGLTPEFLPMITTVTLTRGAARMAKAQVIVKNLAAIHNFGSMDVLCCDKTGTLTSGEMMLDAAYDAEGRNSDKALLLAYVNSYFESGVDNPMDAALLRKAKLNPLDSAVLLHEHPDISGFSKLDEIPFDFERRRVSVLASREGRATLITKGAPESIFPICSRVERAGKIEPFGEIERAAAQRSFQHLCGQGYRVLAVAYAELEAKAHFVTKDERDLVLAGFLSFVDPPRADAAQLIARLHEEGIRVQVLTGDNELVAARVCERVGVSTDEILLGDQVDQLSDAALFHRVESTRVFARVSPAQKHRILLAIKSRGHVVGYVGDGINDAPCLHSADVGISVSSAVDVAREAADIILLEPGLGVLLTGVIEGRRAFGNVMKYLLMGTSSNFGNMFSMAGAAVLLPFLPMLPTQILLNNFLYDLAQISIPSDNVDAEFTRKPRRWDIAVIRRFMLWVGPVSSAYDFLTFFVLLRVFHADARSFHSGWFVESLATQALVIFVIRTAKNPFRSRPSAALFGSTLSVVGFALAAPWLPFARALGFVPLPGAYYAFLALATVTYLGLVECVKRAALRGALS